MSGRRSDWRAPHHSPPCHEIPPDQQNRLLAEETGIRVSEGDLVPFGCLSEAEAHTIHYPNGDVTHCFALCFLARTWQGEPRPDRAETTAVEFVDLDALPEPLHPPTANALELLAAYLRSGSFQVR